MTEIEMLLHCMVRQRGAEAVIKAMIIADEEDMKAATGEGLGNRHVSEKEIKYFVAREEFKLKRRHAKRGDNGNAFPSKSSKEGAEG